MSVRGGPKGSGGGSSTELGSWLEKKRLESLGKRGEWYPTSMAGWIDAEGRSQYFSLGKDSKLR